MAKKKYNFGGYATKFNVKCADGRIIRKDAFTHHDGKTIPLVWQHTYNEPANVLGHAMLEVRDDGVYAYGAFNDTETAKNANNLVTHGDITALSIHANKLKQEGANVLHGQIREVSLVLAGANPGALIDNLDITHSDGTVAPDVSEAIIYSGEEISLENLEHAEKGRTVKEVFDTLSKEQKEVVYAMIGKAVEDSAEVTQDALGDDEDSEEDEKNQNGSDSKINHSTEGGSNMKKNIFDKDNNNQKSSLTHAQLTAIVDDAKKCGSFKEAFLNHAGTYGIDDIDFLFPDARNVTPTPEMISRRMGWVAEFWSSLKKTPFSRIKSIAADITADEARAKGYVKTNQKIDEVFGLLKRTTTPQTVYKKQKLDRDDIIDITDLDVVAWLKMEMRMMLDEELSRAALIGDGRSVISDDKIKEDNIRPIYTDDDLYAIKVQLAVDVTVQDKIDAVFEAMKDYKGTGRPTYYTTAEERTAMRLVKDSDGHRMYKTDEGLAAALGVKKIVDVEVMKGYSRDVAAITYDLLGIVVNPSDYTVGADKGGKVAMFDDFDIDYNQYKYLIETRMSGALTKPHSALVIEKVQPAG